MYTLGRINQTQENSEIQAQNKLYAGIKLAKA